MSYKNKRWRDRAVTSGPRRSAANKAKLMLLRSGQVVPKPKVRKRKKR